MALSDRDVTDALNSVEIAVCVAKEDVDELRFGPNEIEMATDRVHSNIALLVPSDGEHGWKLVEAILFKKEAV